MQNIQSEFWFKLNRIHVKISRIFFVINRIQVKLTRIHVKITRIRFYKSKIMLKLTRILVSITRNIMLNVPYLEIWLI